jgi:hypothetical protein
MKMPPDMSRVLNIALLLFGLAVLLAAAPVALPDVNTDCKQSGTIQADGTIKCNESLPCDVTGQLCQVTKWHKRVQDPFVRFCSCTIRDQFSGADPTTGVCMAISVEKPTGGQVGKCTSGGCTAPQGCKENADRKCTCQQ